MARLVWTGAKIDVSVPPHPCAYSGQDKKKKFNLKKNWVKHWVRSAEAPLTTLFSVKKINLLLHSSLKFFFSVWENQALSRNLKKKEKCKYVDSPW